MTSLFLEGTEAILASYGVREVEDIQEKISGAIEADYQNDTPGAIQDTHETITEEYFPEPSPENTLYRRPQTTVSNEAKYLVSNEPVTIEIIQSRQRIQTPPRGKDEDVYKGVCRPTLVGSESSSSAKRYKSSEPQVEGRYTIGQPVQDAEAIISSPQERITAINLAPLITSAGARGMITQVSHGTYHGVPSTLVVYSLSLLSGHHGFRIKNATIRISFAKHPSARASDRPPSVKKFAPRKIYGLPVTESKKLRIGGDFSATVPLGPVSVGPSASVERESEWEEQHRFSAVGNFWSTLQAAQWDMVHWQVRENKLTKGGLPDRLVLGMIVERDGPFTADVDIKIDTPVTRGFHLVPWPREKPAIFTPSVKWGPPAPLTTFDQLSDRQWRALLPWDDEWVDRFTDEAVGDGSGRGIVAASLAKLHEQSTGSASIDGDASQMATIEVDVSGVDLSGVDLSCE